MFGAPALVSIAADGVVSAEALKLRSRLADSPEKYIEDTLQQIVDMCPDVLAVKEFLPAARAVVSLGREIPVDLAGRQGLIDNLLVTDTGHLVVVETKLWRNPEALREVVAQVLHYGMALMALPVSDLEKAVQKGDRRSPNRLQPDESIAGRLRSKLEAPDQSPGLDDWLDQQVRRGEMLFLIVGDGVHQSVERLAMWLGDFRALPFKFGLVELRFFGSPSGELLVVPRTLLRTKEVARHVVMVKMTDDASMRVKVEIEDTMVQETGAVKVSTTPQRAFSPMDESRLLASIDATPDGTAFVTDLIRKLKEAGFDSDEKTSELQFGILDPHEDTLSPLIRLQTGSLYAAHDGRLFELVGSAAISEHRRAMNKLANFFSPEAVETPVPGSKGCRGPRYDSMKCSAQELADELIRFRDIVRNALGWQEAPAV